MKYEPLTEDTYYHIYNCGNNKEDIFLEEKNYTFFLKLVSKYIIPVSEIFSYCLLKNHFHLLIKTKKDIENKQVSQAFSNLFNAYAKAINKSYNRTGSLFKDRFSRIKIKNEDYLKVLILYINNNAVIHGFVSKILEYPHSSYFALTSNKSTKLNREFVLNLFESVDNFIYVIKNKQNINEELILE
ncbi:transposase [uncultured Winogradskyella sp.]|uniref:transposase n=1 Tax=uncultured Winogradskyella sp. TaxID=395353 RepID=UPI0030DAC085